MMYYNRKTGDLSSVPPWGAAFLVPAARRARYAEWEEVSDDFIPEGRNVFKLEEAEVDDTDINLAEAIIEIYDILEERDKG